VSIRGLFFLFHENSLIGEYAMEDYLPLIIQIISGAVGGIVTGIVKKDLSLGTIWNSIAGIIGGGAGGQLLASLGIVLANNGNLDVQNIGGSIAAGGVGGGALLAIISTVKNNLLKK
jgi:uncharacterized membrane protein YeaQ/YmgE (transglycosylase-associated protein family)